MNINGMARGYMSVFLNEEDFLHHVAVTVERQLKEWDPAYEVYVLKLENYQLTVKKKGLYYSASLTPGQLKKLQSESAYSLDRYLWAALRNEGLAIQKGFGNYIDYVFQ
ncbi:hypothetical protein [Bacillus testis]|uniref:hypothetical protein n=1 Tax=Bacillus testis TaxID=1622072 RepID=UPI00067F5ABD|nr:hypothetical protein [Bacillus testis]